MQPGPSHAERSLARTGRVLAICVTIPLAIAAFVTLGVRANVQRILDDLGAELPRLTRCVLAMPSPVIVCVFLVPGVWLFVKDAMIRNASVKRWGSLVVELAFLGWILLLAVALFRPLVVFIQRIG